LLIFIKAPVAGGVKTRLMPVLAAEQFVVFHRRLVQHCLQAVASLQYCCQELWVGSYHDWWLELASELEQLSPQLTRGLKVPNLDQR